MLTATVVILATTYAIHTIPNTLPPRLSRRISSTLAALDYTHNNSVRISSETRKILRYPAESLRTGLQQSVRKLGEQREDKVRIKRESEVARKYFGNLVRESQEGRGMVEDVDLEGPAPGVAGGYEEGMMV